MFTVVQRWLLLAFCLLSSPLWAADYTRPAIDLVSRNEVVINAPAAVIWPYIVEPGAWKQGARQALVEGKAGTLGAVYRAYLNEKPEQTLLYSKDVELVPEQARSIKLYTPGPPGQGALTGFASWLLEEQNGSTRVSYHVLSEFVLPEEAAGLGSTALQAMQDEHQRKNQRRFQEELERLKVLVESQP